MTDRTPLTARQEGIKQRYIKERGYWSDELLEEILRTDPDYLEAYLNFSAVPWNKGVLQPKMKELIYIAIDATATHLYAPGTRLHIRNALRYGATKEEIMEVFELISVVGIHTCAMGVPILVDELNKMKNQK